MKNEKNIRNRLLKIRDVKKRIEIVFSRDDIKTEEDDIKKMILRNRLLKIRF